MNLKQQLTQKQMLKLQQILTPKLIQMLKTFQLPYIDLVNKVLAEAEENVALEITNQDQVLDYYAEAMADKQQDVADFAYSNKEVGLDEYLLNQLNLEHLGKKEYEIALRIIEAINNRGFIDNYYDLRQGIVADYKVQARKVDEVLKIVQSFEPEGVAARSLKEALLIQLDSQEFENQHLVSVIRKVIKDYLDDLYEKPEKVAQALNIEIEGVQAIIDFIKHNLNPNPAINFSNEGELAHIVPSFEIKVKGEKLEIINMEQEKGIKLMVSAKYQAMLEDKGLDAKTKQYIKEKIAKAKEMIANINKRYENLEKLVQIIAHKQRRFFYQGGHYLQPLLQKDIAQELDVSASTISRIVSSKYIQTPYGIFSFKAFCPRNHFGKTKERLKYIIIDLIKNEPKLSDQQISLLLNNQGIDIARRTVNKYRLQAGLPDMYTRKAM
jgi:RNA polymerase sigma-54 factor